MTDEADRYYSGSGAVPLRGTIIVLLGGALAIAGLSLLYSIAEFYVSHQKLKVLIALCYAMLVGGAVKLLSRFGAVRSRLFSGLLGLALGLFAVYSAWMWFLVILSGWNMQVAGLSPTVMWEAIQALAGAGIWRNRNGIAVGATELAVWWSLEALAVIAAATYMATTNREPYCEACGRWTEASPIAALPPAPIEALKAELEDERYESLYRLGRQPLTPGAGLTAQVWTCRDCKESNFLTMSDVSVKVKGSEEKVTSTAFVQHLLVPEEVARWVRERDQHAVAPAVDDPPIAQG
ncbi:MAG: hypothetical protein KF774_11040 [Planctomyces sp.]|nr:hypothetical protein [Planctomyces sp.]